MSLFIRDTQDTHGYANNQEYYDFIFPSKFFPFIIKTIENKATIFTNPTNLDSINIGDEVISIDGELVENLRIEHQKIFSYSNPAVMLRKTDFMLNGGKTTNALLKLKNANNEIYEATLDYSTDRTMLNIITLPEWTNMDQTDCSIGYVNMGKLEKENVDTMMAEFIQKDAIIFDLRNYPNGTILPLVNYLFTKPLKIVHFAIPNSRSPGSFRYHQEQFGRTRYR